MSRAVRAMTGGRKKPLHAPRGVTEGGQFIGRASILHAIVRMLSGGGGGRHSASAPKAPGSVTLDPRMQFKRPRILAHARKRGVKLKRGAPQRDIVAALRADSKMKAHAARGSASARALRPHAGAAADAVQAKRLLDRWSDLGKLHGLDQLAILDQQRPEVLRRVAKARGVPTDGSTVGRFGGGSAGLVWALAADAGKARGAAKIRDHGDVPASLRALKDPSVTGQSTKLRRAASALASLGRAIDAGTGGSGSAGTFGRAPATPSHGGRVDASGVAAALKRWRKGSGPSDPFEAFDTRAMRDLAKQRNLALPARPGRREYAIALMSDERRAVRAARSVAANPPKGVMPGAPVLGNETKYHRDLTDVAHLQRAVASGVKSRKMLEQGNVGETWLVEFNDGTKAVHKWGKMPWGGFGPKDQADAEQLVGLLGNAIGAPVPRVYRHNDHEIYMDFVEGDMATRALGIGIADPPPKRVLDSPAGQLIGLLDLLVANHDRHNKNWMVDANGGVHGIDHGLAWAAAVRGESPHRPRHAEFGFTRRYTKPGGGGMFGGGGDWKRNDLTSDQIAELRKKLDALKPDFDRLGRIHWHEFAQQRLDALAKHAKDAAPTAAGRRGPASVRMGIAVRAVPVRRAAPRRAPAKRLPKGVGTYTGARGALAQVQRLARQGDHAVARRLLAEQPNKVLVDILVRDLHVPQWQIGNRPTKAWLIDKIARRLNLPRA